MGKAGVIETPRTHVSGLALWSALGIVYVVWGSTYLGIRVVVDVAGQPPLFPTGARFLIAGSVLALVVMAREGTRALVVPWREAASSVLLGFLFLCCGVGVVSVAEQTVPSGLAALLVAAMPLWVVLLRASVGRERPHRLTWLGTTIGFVGIAVLARPGSHEDVQLWGVLLVLLATMCWGFGAFLSPRLTLPRNAFVTAVYQMWGGGLILLIAGISFRRVQRLLLRGRPRCRMVGICVSDAGRIDRRLFRLRLVAEPRASLADHHVRVHQPGGRGLSRLVDSL